MTARPKHLMLLLAPALLLSVVPAASAQTPEPEGPVNPTAAQLTASVSVVSLSGAVTPISLSRSVTPLQVKKKEGTRTTVTVSSDVLFAFGSADVAPDATARLRTLAAEVPAGAPVLVVGHTDDVGDDASNNALSLRRADAVAALLQAAVPGLVASTEGRGEKEPVAPNSSGGQDDPAARAANRRVVLSYES